MNLAANIAQAWKISLKYKFLWLFGLFAAGLNSEIWEVISGVVNFIPQAASRASLPLSLPSALQQAFIEPTFAQSIVQPKYTALIWLISILIFLIGTYLKLISQASLYLGISKITKRKKITLRDQFITAHEFLWRLLGLSLYTAIWALVPTAGGFIAISLMAVAGIPQWLLVILIVLALAIWIIFILSLAVVNQFAGRSIIISEVGVLNSLPYSFTLIKKNLVDVFLLWVAASGLSLLYFFCLATIGIIGFISIFTTTLIFAPLGLLATTILGLLAAIIYSWGSTFISSLWTLSYIELNKNTN